MGAAFLVLLVMYCVYRRNRTEGKATDAEQWIEWNDGPSGEESYRKSLRGAEGRLKSLRPWQLQMSSLDGNARLSLGAGYGADTLSPPPRPPPFAPTASAAAPVPAVIERRTISGLDMNDLYYKMKQQEPVGSGEREARGARGADEEERGEPGPDDDGDGDGIRRNDPIPAAPKAKQGSVFGFFNPFMSRPSFNTPAAPASSPTATGATSRNPVLFNAGQLGADLLVRQSSRLPK